MIFIVLIFMILHSLLLSYKFPFTSNFPNKKRSSYNFPVFRQANQLSYVLEDEEEEEEEEDEEEDNLYMEVLMGNFKSGTCPRCKGTGKCKTCNGSGKIKSLILFTQSCTVCYGSGKCKVCHGKGIIA